MSSGPETRIATKIQRWIKEQGGDSWSVHGGMFQRSGEPDLDGWLPNGIHLKLEVKTATGKPTKIQIHRLRIYHRAGYCAGLVRSVDDTKELVNAYINKDYSSIGDEYGLYND